MQQPTARRHKKVENAGGDRFGKRFLVGLVLKVLLVGAVAQESAFDQRARRGRDARDKVVRGVRKARLFPDRFGNAVDYALREPPALLGAGLVKRHRAGDAAVGEFVHVDRDGTGGAGRLEQFAAGAHVCLFCGCERRFVGARHKHGKAARFESVFHLQTDRKVQIGFLYAGFRADGAAVESAVPEVEHHEKRRGRGRRS